MALHPNGGFLLAELVNDRLTYVRDLNGDGDALDIGEAVPFAEAFESPVGIVLAD